MLWKPALLYTLPGHFQSGSQMSNLNTLIQMHDMMTDSNEVADFRSQFYQMHYYKLIAFTSIFCLTFTFSHINGTRCINRRKTQMYNRGFGTSSNSHMLLSLYALIFLNWFLIWFCMYMYMLHVHLLDLSLYSMVLLVTVVILVFLSSLLMPCD